MLPTIPTNFSRNQLHAVMAPRSLRRELMTHLIARLALAGPVQVLDGGNRFDACGLSRELRRRGRNFYIPLKRVQISRAFTCYQMAAMLEETAPLSTPTVILDLLATFCDESVPFPERRRLLGLALKRIRILAQQSAVIISAPLPQSDDEFSTHLEANVDRVWRFEAESAPVQPRLF
ncbi:MAG: hypothetical protein ABIG63_12040 [Chloroflexota bacterium]